MCKSKLTIVVIAFSMLLLPLVCLADGNKNSVVHVKSAWEGAGFIVYISEQRDEVYVLTAEHLIRGGKSASIRFYGHTEEVTCEVVKQGTLPAEDATTMSEGNVASKEDQALLVVRGKRLIPDDIAPLALPPEDHPVLHITGGEAADIIGFPVSGLPWSVIRVTLEGEDKSRGLLEFEAALGRGVSGGPVIIGDYVVGMAVTGGGNAGSPGKAISISPIRSFLQGVITIPSPPSDDHYKPSQGRTEVDPAAKACAAEFLGLLAQNKLREAYAMYADATKQVFSQGQFVGAYNQYVSGAVSGLIERRLTGIQEYPSVPGAGAAMVGDTYVLTFEAKFRAAPTWTIFEIVTVFRQGSIWRIANFSGNSLQDTATSLPTGVSDGTARRDADNTPEHLASLALDLLHTNQLKALYNNDISDLQKQTGLRDLASCIAAFSGTIQMWPGLPLSRDLLVSRDLDRIPGYFGDLKQQFHYVVYLSKYQQASLNEGVYLVLENGAWKIAALEFHEAF